MPEVVVLVLTACATTLPRASAVPVFPLGGWAKELTPVGATAQLTTISSR
jgi:hypothetical protein